jgi:acetolactate synthase small subunit
MVLKGIAGTLDRRVALINDRTFSKGESGEIKSGTNEFKIRVIDIKDRSVTIERAGQTNELPLVENLLPLDGRK